MRSALLLVVALALPSFGLAARAEDKPVPEDKPASDEYHTPRAGEPLHTEVFGEKVDVEKRDRSQVFAAVAGGELNTPRIADHRTSLIAALYYRGFYDARFARASVSVFENDVEYAERPTGYFEIAAHAANDTPPGGHTVAISDEESYFDRIKSGRVLGELGPGFRMGTPPDAIDNELRVDLFYEAAWVYSRRAHATGSFVRLPPDTLEHGLHLRVLYDGIKRNLLELPHEGISAGGDFEALRRDRWGDIQFTTEHSRKDQTRDFLRADAYFVGVTGLPMLSERHRFTFMLHGGWSPPARLDRFSQPSLGAGPLTTESYDLSRVLLPGLLVQQVSVRDYVVPSVEYRFEPIFFVYLHLRWTGAFCDHLETRADGDTHWVRQMGHSLAAAVSSGFVFSSSIYLEYAFSTAQLRGRDGHSLLFVLTKAF
jgi:hypothetical protein